MCVCVCVCVCVCPPPPRQLLLDRVRTLEGALTKKMMSADLKIVQTVKENDKLRQKLVKIYSSLENVRTRQTGLEELLSSLREQSSTLTHLQQSLADVKSSVLQLESKQPLSPRRQVTSPPLTQVGGLSVTFVRSTSSRTESPVGMAMKGEQLRERNEGLARGTMAFMHIVTMFSVYSAVYCTARVHIAVGDSFVHCSC